MTPPDLAPEPIAVFDIGKTSAKLLAFGPDLSVLHEERFTPTWIGHGEARVLESAGLWAWMKSALGHAREATRLGGVIVTTHGCTVALLGREGLVHPILDYECAVPPEVEAAFSEIVPPFAETLSPAFPAGINYGKQLFWLEAAQPALFMAAQSIVPYPQYWGCKFGAPPVSEVTSIGSHTHLWSPTREDFSSLVDARGWRAKFPPLVRAGEVLGSYHIDGAKLRVHNGLHDSNAALYLHRHVGEHADATVVSTGTWVVAMNASCPIDALRADRDMLVNVSVDGEIIPTARFMGGREFDLISDAARLPLTQEVLERAIHLGQCALPSFAPGGPFPGLQGELVGPPPQSQTERAAIATLYVACMTSTVLDLLRSRGTVIVDGGLAYNKAYTGLLAALRSGQRVLSCPSSEGTAAGAAAVAYAALGHRPKIGPYAQALSLPATGLAEYFQNWRRQCELRAARH